MTRTKLLVSVLLAVCLLGLIALPATADSYSYRDGRDIKNRKALDIVSTRVGHRRAKLLQAVTLERRVTPKTLDPNHAFVGFAVSTDPTFNTVNRYVFVFGGSRFHAVVTDANGNFVSRARVFHPNRRTIGAISSRGALGTLPGYYWAAFASSDISSNCCFDIAPNRSPLIHDLTPPSVGSPSFADNNGTTAIPSSTVPITWLATDRVSVGSFAGRCEGGWTGRRPGRTSPAREVRIRRQRLQLDEDDELRGDRGTRTRCASVSDWANNRATSPLGHFSVPYDDTNGVFGYSATVGPGRRTTLRTSAERARRRASTGARRPSWCQ